MLSIRDNANGSGADAGTVLHFKYYYYNPSMGAAILFMILFLLVTSFHFFKMIRSKTWFMVPFCIGGVFEFIGYIGRIGSATQTPEDWTLGPYIIQALFLLVAPALFAASIYMELGRIVLMVDGQRALFIKRTWMTKIFVAGDVVSFMMQGAGGGLLSSGKVDSIKAGKNVVVGGLIVQIIFFGLFVIAAALFHLRMNKMPTQQWHDHPSAKHLYGLYGVSILIFWRSIVRVIEYGQGYDGYVITHEVYIYVFDGLLMFFAMCVMGWIHPAEVANVVRGMRKPKGSGGEEGAFEGRTPNRNETRMNNL